VVAALATVGTLGSVATVAAVGYYSQGLPSLDSLTSANLAQTTHIYDRNGALLTSLYEQNRTVVPLSKVALPLQDATISIEDRTFYSHQGVDYRRLAIAVAYDVTHRSSTLGASTITEQVVKDDVLCTTCSQAAGNAITSGVADRSLTRKIRELLLAEELERRYSKQQILELYLNSIFYGNRASGIETAAQTYFGVPAAKLDLAQAAFLAGLPQDPAGYNPFGGVEQKAAAKARWQGVLSAMVANRKITVAQEDAALKVDIWKQMADHRTATAGGNGADPLTGHFTDYVIQYLRDHGYDDKTLFTGGLAVYTTLDLPMQQLADAKVKAAVAEYANRGVNTGGLLALNPQNGEILAMVGSADYASEDIRGQVNLTLSPRQPGSSFKPYTYGYALSTGQFNAATLVDDKDATIGGTKFTDWDGRLEGWIPLRQAVEQSRNLPALWTFKAVGPQNVIDFAHKLGLTGNFDPSTLTTTIGSGDVRMIDHLAALSAFDNGGHRIYAHPIVKIVDTSGKPLAAFPENTVGGQVITPQLAYVMTDILHGVPGKELGMAGLPVAGKTGTTDAYTTAWMMGYTPDLAVGTMLAHVNKGDTCTSGYANLMPPGVQASGWICPTRVVWGEDVGLNLFRPFLKSYYSGGRAWPASWKTPTGLVTINVCRLDGMRADANTPSGQSYPEVFVQGLGEPKGTCGSALPPGVAPYPTPAPTPIVPSPSPTPKK